MNPKRRRMEATSELERSILDRLAAFDMVGLLRELVEVPSPVGDEGRLAETLGERLAQEGFEVRYDVVEGSRRNVLGTFRFPKPGPRLWFNGHLDTVPVSGEWETDPHRLTERDGRLYGLGALDMKGGIAASVAAAVAAAGADLGGEIGFSGVVDEEGCSNGARAQVERGLDGVDAVIIGEPCFGSEANPVPILTPGKVLYRVRVMGKAAHGFQPDEGINAVEEAARIVAALPSLRQVEHPALGKGPVGTLKIAGGYETYAVVVPERCEFIVSRMIVPGETREACKADLEDLIASLDLRAGTSVDLIPPYYAPLETDLSDPLFSLFGHAYEEEMGRPPAYGAVPIITDASIFYGIGGVPTLVFGPHGGGIHQVNEFVEPAALASCARVYAKLAARFLRGSGPSSPSQPDLR